MLTTLITKGPTPALGFIITFKAPFESPLHKIACGCVIDVIIGFTNALTVIFALAIQPAPSVIIKVYTPGLEAEYKNVVLVTATAALGAPEPILTV